MSLFSLSSCQSVGVRAAGRAFLPPRTSYSMLLLMYVCTTDPHFRRQRLLATDGLGLCPRHMPYSTCPLSSLNETPLVRITCVLLQRILCHSRGIVIFFDTHVRLPFSLLVSVPFQLMAQARQEGIEPDIVSYNHAMKGMAIQKQWTRARKLLKRMVSEGLCPDVRTYNGLVEAAGMGSPSPRKHMIEVSVLSRCLMRRAFHGLVGMPVEQQHAT